jgi:hypothetical protein
MGRTVLAAVVAIGLAGCGGSLSRVVALDGNEYMIEASNYGSAPEGLQQATWAARGYCRETGRQYMGGPVGSGSALGYSPFVGLHSTATQTLRFQCFR